MNKTQRELTLPLMGNCNLRTALGEMKNAYKCSMRRERRVVNLCKDRKRKKEINRFQMGIIPIVDLEALVAVFRDAAEDLLGARSPPDLARDWAPLAFQLPVEPPFFRRGRLVYGRLPPFELDAACPRSKSSPGSKPGDGAGSK